MFRWKMKEVLLTQDAALYGLAQNALRDGGIRYETNVVNSGSQNRRTGGLGRLGENVNLEIHYYIYVNPKDEEEAEHLIAQCRDRLGR